MLVIQDRKNPSLVLDAIAAQVPANLSAIFFAVAYVTRDGSSLLLDRIRKRVGRVTFANIPKHLVTTCDYGLTEPEALEDWLQLGAQVDIANGTNIAAGTLQPKVAFHPKIFAFRAAQTDWQSVVGSANLTTRGLTVNSEATVSLTIPHADMSTAQQQLVSGAVSANAALIQSYRQLRNANPPPQQLARDFSSVPTPPQIGPGTQVFGDAVDNGLVNPITFDRFWVQTLALSGGSGNQVELPRRGNSFFGFTFNNYVPKQQLDIGQVDLKSAGQTWPDRILKWHGNNGMERINMPTVAMGGYLYAHSAVCFRRLPTGTYDFQVAGWNSNLAKSWRAASASNNHLYYLGANSPRICGLL